MLTLRSILFFLGLVITLLPITLAALLCFWASVEYRYKITSQWAKFNNWWLKITVNLGFEVIGEKNIPKQPCVVLSNHQSTWETLIFQIVLPQQVWVLKKQLLYIPIFGWGLALTSPIIIDRGHKLKALKSVISQGKHRLSRGLWVVVFAEGSREGSGVGHYETGGVMIAQKANVAILPIYHNAGRYWAKGQFVKTPGIIKLVIGKAIDIEAQQGKTAKQLSQQVENWAKEQHNKYN